MPRPGGRQSYLVSLTCKSVASDTFLPQEDFYIFNSLILWFDFWLLTSFLKNLVTWMQSMARMNKKDSWLFWWTLYLTVSKDYLKCHMKSWKSKASQRKEWGFFERLNPSKSYLLICWTSVFLQAVAWIFLAIFSLIRFQADYLLVVGVCLTLSIANIVGFTRCRKGTLINYLNLICHAQHFVIFYLINMSRQGKTVALLQSCIPHIHDFMITYIYLLCLKHIFFSFSISRC